MSQVKYFHGANFHLQIKALQYQNGLKIEIHYSIFMAKLAEMFKTSHPKKTKMKKKLLFLDLKLSFWFVESSLELIQNGIFILERLKQELVRIL